MKIKPKISRKFREGGFSGITFATIASVVGVTAGALSIGVTAANLAGAFDPSKPISATNYPTGQVPYSLDSANSGEAKGKAYAAAQAGTAPTSAQSATDSSTITTLTSDVSQLSNQNNSLQSTVKTLELVAVVAGVVGLGAMLLKK